MQSTLITTELEETWPNNGKVLFLGEWCRLHARQERWRRLDAVVLPYHWDDRIKLKHDFDYLQALNLELLLELVPVMNRLHQVNHEVRFWRLLLGYWLNVYTATVFDRWASVECAADMGIEFDSITIPTPKRLLAPNDTANFIPQAVLNPYWNHALFAILITRKSSIRVIPTSHVPGEDSIRMAQHDQESRIYKNLAKRLATLSHCFKRNDRVVMASTYLPRPVEWALDRKFGQVPGIYFGVPSVPLSAFDVTQRNWKLPIPPQSDEFGSLIRELLPQIIPRVFVEGFSQTRRVVDNLPWPRSPRVIWTSNYHFSNDMFKLWAAQKCADGTRLVIGEHGGLGTGAFNGARSYELSIADRYLSTGWTDATQPQIAPVGNFRQIGRTQSWCADGQALLVCGIMPRYGFDIRSMMLSSQVLDYFEDQFRFIDALPHSIRKALLVRLYQEDYEWGQKARWKERHAGIALDSGTQSMWQVAQRCRLFISTYNATTYIESLSLNVPTVMFWNPERWEVKEEALPLFKELNRAGVFHETPASAANHISDIWDDVPSWWQSKDVQVARTRFCDVYAACRPDILERIEAVLREEAHLSEATT